ncbi:MAG: HPr family phosphocarrier protein, partial [Oscillospiraceae bacterium]
MHARPASEFSEAASKFTSKIKIVNLSDPESEQVNAKSVVFILTLGAGKGSEIEITASGEDEQEAVDSLIAFIDSGLGE